MLSLRLLSILLLPRRRSMEGGTEHVHQLFEWMMTVVGNAGRVGGSGIGDGDSVISAIGMLFLLLLLWHGYLRVMTLGSWRDPDVHFVF